MDEITQRLKYLVDPETGQPVIECIFRREDIYDEPTLVRCRI
jgi:hypothetical protein